METKARVKIIKDDFLYKTLFVSIFSTVAFVVYNGYLGIRFGDAFAIGISIYYVLLVWIKSTTLIIEKKISNQEESFKISVRIKNYKISSIHIFVIDLCLIAPIILMVTQPKAVSFGIIPAITMATYSLYKIVFAIINYNRSKKSQNLTTILLQEINIIDAIVSILTLQHTLIMVNDAMDQTMQVLSLVTSIAFIALIIVFSITSFFKNKKLVKSQLD